MTPTQARAELDQMDRDMRSRLAARTIAFNREAAHIRLRPFICRCGVTVAGGEPTIAHVLSCRRK